MKVIEIISDTNIGGAGILLINRLRCTDTDRYETLVLIPCGSMLEKRLIDIGIDCIPVSCKGDRSLECRAVKEYIKIFKRVKPDIINCHGALSARIAAKICKIPVKICTRHCVFPIKKRETLFGKFNNMLSDRFIAVADAAKENLIELGIAKDKISVIINGAMELRKISLEEKARLKKDLNISEKSLVLGFCARLERCKGHEWFFDAVRILSKDGVDFKVLLIGDGSLRNHLEALSRELGIDGRVIFCGFISDVSPLMNIVDININCSTGTETSSLALSEGMSLGIPAIVSDYGGNPYMIKHGVNGFVCKTGDSEKMAEYIVRLKNDRELYSKMSKNARERFENELNARSMTEKTNRLYDTLHMSMSQSRISQS